MKLTRFVALALLPVAIACAQPTNLDNEASGLSIDSTSGAWKLSWWGTSGRTYFILHSETLMSWTFLPVIEQGSAAWMHYGFWLSPTPPRVFFRLRYTDQPSTDPYGDDFDGDGIPNGAELEMNLNPFDAADATYINGGLTNLQIYQQSQDGGGDPAASNAVSLLVYSP